MAQRRCAQQQRFGRINVLPTPLRRILFPERHEAVVGIGLISELLAAELPEAVGPVLGPGLAVESGNTCALDGCTLDADR